MFSDGDVDTYDICEVRTGNNVCPGTTNVLCTYEDRPTPTGGTSGGGVSGGSNVGGNGSGNNPPPNPKDPCIEKAKIATMMQKIFLNNSTTEIRSSTIASPSTEGQYREYGIDYHVEFDGTAFVSSWDFDENVSVAPGTATSWSVSESWEPGLYSVGNNHSHIPDGSGVDGPNPHDVMWLSEQGARAQSSGTAGSNFFKANSFMITTTVTDTYVITVKDWSKFSQIAAGYNEADFIAEWKANALKPYGSAESALLTQFPDALNIYKAAAGSTDFAPKELNSAGTAAQTKNCPN